MILFFQSQISHLGLCYMTIGGAIRAAPHEYCQVFQFMCLQHIAALEEAYCLKFLLHGSFLIVGEVLERCTVLAKVKAD